MNTVSLFPKKASATVKTLLHFKNRKTYSLIIPLALIKENFPQQIGRKNYRCQVHAHTNSDGFPELTVRFEDYFS
jgi:hypothetical protein